MQTHTGRQSHSCDVCNKSFRQSSYLSSHIFLYTIVELEKQVMRHHCYSGTLYNFKIMVKSFGEYLSVLINLFMVIKHT